MIFDIRCEACRALIGVDVPLGVRHRDDDEHVRKMMSELRKRGWRGAKPMDLRCPDCVKATTAGGSCG